MDNFLWVSDQIKQCCQGGWGWQEGLPCCTDSACSWLCSDNGWGWTEQCSTLGCSDSTGCSQPDHSRCSCSTRSAGNSGSDHGSNWDFPFWTCHTPQSDACVSPGLTAALVCCSPLPQCLQGDWWEPSRSVLVFLILWFFFSFCKCHMREKGISIQLEASKLEEAFD